MLLHPSASNGLFRGTRTVHHSSRRLLRLQTPPLQHERRLTSVTTAHALAAPELLHTQDLHTHVIALLDLADAAAATADAAAKDSSSSSGGFLAPLTDTLETVLKTIQAQLDRLHVPYSYGYSIILLTAFVKLLTLPLTKIQVCQAGSLFVDAEGPCGAHQSS